MEENTQVQQFQSSFWSLLSNTCTLLMTETFMVKTEARHFHNEVLRVSTSLQEDSSPSQALLFLNRNHYDLQPRLLFWHMYFFPEFSLDQKHSVN